MRRETRYVSEAACPTSSRNDEDWRLRLPGLGDAVRTGDEERRRRPAESVRARSAPASSTEARIANAKQRPPPRPAAQRSGEIRIGFLAGARVPCVQGSSDGAGKRAAGGRIDGGVLVSRDS